jgi:hypothetical protein
MTALAKASLQEIDANGVPAQGTEIKVQFNPQSLKLELATKVEGGDTKGRQVRQHVGKTSTTLSFDLHFDTADEGGSANAPVSVRTKTAQVERFVLPKKQNGVDTGQKPPKCRFHWNELIFEGVIESISIEFTLFAQDGTPLRAKIGVSIKEQDAKYEAKLSGPDAKQNSSAPLPGFNNTGPGSGGGGPADSSAQALAGESAADFATRMGLDPSAWRGIAGQLGGGSSLSLQAGVSINFSSSLSASGGVGLSAGIESGAGVSLEASFGLDAGASLSAAANGSGGFALTAAGGIGAALETVAIVSAESAAADARRAFGSAVPSTPPSRPPAVNVADGATAVGVASIPATSTASVNQSATILPVSTNPKPALPEQTRTPLIVLGRSEPSLRKAAPSAPTPPLADPRAVSYGLGIPLRPRVGGATELRAGQSAGRIPLHPSVKLGDILNSADPSVPPWVRLPSDGSQKVADRAQAVRFPKRPCGCK